MKNKHTLNQELANWKAQDEANRNRRAEIMFTLYRYHNLAMPEIAKIYGCKRQFVQQVIKRYEANAA